MEENNKINNFEEYSFTADFGGEIYFEDSARLLIGKLDDNTSCFWDSINGNCFEVYTNNRLYKYDLTPIKKEWYKDENNIGKLIKSDKFNTFAIFREYKDNKIFIEFNNYSWDVDLFRPATKEEINSIVIKE